MNATWSCPASAASSQAFHRPSSLSRATKLIGSASFGSSPANGTEAAGVRDGESVGLAGAGSEGEGGGGAGLLACLAWTPRLCSSALINEPKSRLALMASYRVVVSSSGGKPNSSSSNLTYSSYCRSAAAG